MTHLIRSIREAISFIFDHGLWRSLHRKDAPWLIQFGKYGMCGALAVIVHNAAVVYLSYNVIPAVETLVADQDLRARNQTLNNLIVFPLSNVFAYVTNAIWVFNTGRHSRKKEFFYFTMISLVSFVAGLIGGPLLVRLFGVPFWVSQVGFVVSAAMVNFVCRKFFVFKG